MKIAVLYSASATHIGTVVDHLVGLKDPFLIIDYLPATHGAPLLPLASYEALVIHYSVRLCYPGYISPNWLSAITKFRGRKVAFVQDEYERPLATLQQLHMCEVETIFTCMPPDVSSVMYPACKTVRVLTGYVPEHLLESPYAQPYDCRKIVIGYRGRRLGAWYGRLGQEKLQIGLSMLKACRDRKIPCDIAWDDSARVYGSAWPVFMGSVRATLGTESGASIVDWEGSAHAWCVANPQATIDLVCEAYDDGQYKMAQISPKVFEATALRTALIMYRGRYSGLVEPWLHYIPLEKDLSNTDEVFDALADKGRVIEMTDRAYEEVARNPKNSYRVLGRKLARELGCA